MFAGKKCRTYIHHLFHTPLRTWYSCQNFGFVFVGERNNMEIHYKGILLNCISSSWQEIIALFIVKQKAMWSKEQKEHYQHELVQRIQRLINTLESAGNVAFLLCSNLPTSSATCYYIKCHHGKVLQEQCINLSIWKLFMSSEAI